MRLSGHAALAVVLMHDLHERAGVSVFPPGVDGPGYQVFRFEFRPVILQR